MGKNTNLLKLFHKKDCLGWAYHVDGRRYCWQNANDLGLIGDIEECGKECHETVLRKIKLDKGGYLYILRNNWGLSKDDSIDTATLPTVKAIIKDCWNIQLTKHERMLVKRYMGWEE